jgi:hypothetical protein
MKDLVSFGPFYLDCEEIDVEKEAQRFDMLRDIQCSKTEQNSLSYLLMEPTDFKNSQQSEILEDFTLEFPTTTCD